MNKLLYILFIFSLSTLSVFSQKTALQYLNEAPLTYTKDICSSSKMDYLKFKAKLDHYCAKIQEEIYRREALSQKNDLSVEAKSEIGKLMKQLFANAEEHMGIRSSLSENTPYPDWISEEESSKCISDKLIIRRIVQFNGMLAIHAAKESDRPNSPEEGKAAQNEYCAIMTPKCKRYLEWDEKALRASLPIQQRLGELEYSGPTEVKELKALGVVYSYLSTYADILFEGNISY